MTTSCIAKLTTNFGGQKSWVALRFCQAPERRRQGSRRCQPKGALGLQDGLLKAVRAEPNFCRVPEAG
jgi:hypothetical protein